MVVIGLVKGKVLAVLAKHNVVVVVAGCSKKMPLEIRFPAENSFNYLWDLSVASFTCFCGWKKETDTNESLQWMRSKRKQAS